MRGRERWLLVVVMMVEVDWSRFEATYRKLQSTKYSVPALAAVKFMDERLRSTYLSFQKERNLQPRSQ